MIKVFVGLGSNIEPQKYIARALQALAAQFGHLELSPVYESEAVGFDGDNFINLVVSLETELSVGELSTGLRKIEDDNDRDRDNPRFSARTLDIDILTYGTAVGEVDGVVLPRDEILKNAFVLLPLSELAPQDKHPERGVTYKTLWQDFDGQNQHLWRVDLKPEVPV